MPEIASESESYLAADESIVSASPTHLALVHHKPEADAPATQTQKPERAPRERRGGAYDDQLAWLIQCGDASLGARGTLAGVISQIERGSVGGTGNLDASGSYTHPYTDLQLGLGLSGIGDVERHRHLSAAWALLPAATRARLTKRYSAPRAAYRADQGYGARDRYVEGSDGRTGQHQATRTGTHLALGEYAGLAFEVCENPALLFIACVEPSPVRKGKINQSEQARRAKVVREALARAHAVDAEDHAEWFAAKARVPALRTMKERTGRDRSVGPAAGPQQVGRAARSGRALRPDSAVWGEVAKAIGATRAVAAE